VKKRLLSTLVVGLLAVPSLGASPAGAVERRAQAPSFDNCRQLRKQWVYGVAKSQKAARKQVNSGHYKPRVSSSGYRANSSLDADNDGTACEVLS
jgi:excalibur calcium-binding domain-containing protein